MIYEYGIDKKELMRLNHITRKETDEYIKAEDLHECVYCGGLYPNDDIRRDDHIPDAEFCALCYKENYKEIVALFKISPFEMAMRGSRFCDPTGICKDTNRCH